MVKEPWIVAGHDITNGIWFSDGEQDLVMCPQCGRFLEERVRQLNKDSFIISCEQFARGRGPDGWLNYMNKQIEAGRWTRKDYNSGFVVTPLF